VAEDAVAEDAADDVVRAPQPGGGGARRGPFPAPAGAGPGPVLAQAFDRSSLDALRAAVAAHAFRAGAPPAQAGDLVLVVHELAVNAVVHGAGRGRLRAWRLGQAMHCEVTDDGPRPGTAGAARWPGRDTQPPDAAWWPAERGHGLWVISQLADQTSLRSGPGGTLASARLPLGPRGLKPAGT
jgi:anti-sigma regulatory factor (Ser/Thr protein kinase)